jgi:hypothetical protein
MTNLINGWAIAFCHPERSEAKSKDLVELPVGAGTGWKACPRGLRPLRCSLDFARNDNGIFARCLT